MKYIKIINLPPYSPDLRPIKMCGFINIKIKFKKIKKPELINEIKNYVWHIKLDYIKK